MTRVETGRISAGIKVAPAAAPAKKQVEITQLLRWTFRDELPKDKDCGGSLAGLGFGHAWGSISEYGELLARVDDASYNRWGVVADMGARGEPHPDALVVANAVLDLDRIAELALPDAWNPLEDMGDLGPEGAAAIARAIAALSVVGADNVRRLKCTPRRLIFRHAIMGGMPETAGEVPVRKVIVGSKGKPAWFAKRMVTDAYSDTPREIEVDGWSATRRRPVHGAYQKTYLDPDPMESIIGRAEYEIWRATLDILTDDLIGTMHAHEVVASTLPARPWMEPPSEPCRVLPDLTEVRVAREARPAPSRPAILGPARNRKKWRDGP